MSRRCELARRLNDIQRRRVESGVDRLSRGIHWKSEVLLTTQELVTFP